MMRRSSDIGNVSAVMFAQFKPRPGRVTMPDVCCDLIWVGGRLYLNGPQSRAMKSSSVGQDVQLLNIDPLVARAWLGVPLSELTDRRIPFDDVDRSRAGPLASLFDDGQAGGLVRAGVPRLEVDLRARAAEQVLRAGGSVAAAAKAAVLSERQLERLFVDRFGLLPKQYATIRRFRRAMRQARLESSLAQAALGAGYADQSHFNRDVRAFSGTTPLALLPNVGNFQDAQVRLRDD